MTTTEDFTEDTPAPRIGNRVLLVPALAGAAVSIVLGVYGGLHTPSGIAVNLAGFSSALTVKVWLSTLAFVLALAQLVSALIMYGKLPVSAPSWIGLAHRWTGRAAFVAAIPVAVHCLYALGFQTFDARTVAHSLLGCFFFGAFTVKMLVLSKDETPGWALPLAGGATFAGLVLVWLTSALWFFTTSGVKF
jgi:hypothetical protein